MAWTEKFIRMLMVSFMLLGIEGCQSSRVKENPSRVEAVVFSTQSLLEQLDSLDKDHDRKITALDKVPLEVAVTNEKGQKFRLQGVYPVSIAWQEAALAREHKKGFVPLSLALINEPPLARVRRLISEKYWDSLTRRLDRDGMLAMLDTKTQSQGLHLYVPYQDTPLFHYYKSLVSYWKERGLKVEVHRLPRKITPAYVRQLDGKHGILSLAYKTQKKSQGSGKAHLKIEPLPFVVPGGRFNEMYGWDSYFITLGLLKSDRVELAQSMVDHFVYQIKHYGKILNANRSYYLTRSQPPFTTSMIRAVWDRVDQKHVHSQIWLRHAMSAALKEYRQVWMDVPRLDRVTRLSRYYGEGLGPCPEVEPGHYDHALTSFVGRSSQFSEAKNPTDLVNLITQALALNPQLQLKDKKLSDFFVNDRGMRESGHDTTFRWHDRETDYLSVDLNSLLYKTEADFFALVTEGLLPSGEFGSAASWKTAMEARQSKMNQLMWDHQKSLFVDWNLKEKKPSTFISATAFYPLWAGLASQEQAKGLVQSALPQLEQAGGVASTALSSLNEYHYPVGLRQWDYPYGWAPHQILIWQGLKDYGFGKDSSRLAQKWSTMIEMGIRDYNGTIPEKYDVVNRTHQVFAEYGNVGTDFSYITKEGFGWMNTSILLAPDYIGAD